MRRVGPLPGPVLTGSDPHAGPEVDRFRRRGGRKWWTPARPDAREGYEQTDGQTMVSPVSGGVSCDIGVEITG